MHATEQTRAQMFSTILNWQQSGLSQKAYCQQNDIRYHVFHYWYKSYRDKHKSLADNNSSFIPLQIKSCLPLSVTAELVLADGRRLLFHQPVDANFLRSLIQ